jgi:hypothetical protein
LTLSRSAPPSALASICSTSSRSIAMFPTLRKKRTRAPLAETSNCSATPEPLKVIASLPA